MAQQFEAAQTILQQAPKLQDDTLLRHYARQAFLAHSKAHTTFKDFSVLMLCQIIPANGDCCVP